MKTRRRVSGVPRKPERFIFVDCGQIVYCRGWLVRSVIGMALAGPTLLSGQSHGLSHLQMFSVYRYGVTSAAAGLIFVFN